MANYNQGILGAFSGKLGNVIGTFWKGKSIMRIVPANVANPNTPAQQAMRARFTLLVQFLSTNAKFFKIGFSAMSAKITELNAAFRANYEAGVTGLYPSLKIDAKNLVTSKGDLASLNGFAAASTVPNTIELTWNDNSGDQGASNTDKINVAVFDEATGESVTILQAADRLTESYTFNLPAAWSGKSVSVYAYMTSESILFGFNKTSHVSNSVKVNGITVA